MKFFFLILSCFMLYLNCLPCSDSTECKAKEAIIVSTTADHQEHNHDEEACTPFCSCSCCANSAYYLTFSKVSVNKVFFQPGKYFLHNIAADSEMYFSIFQPPKIA